MVAFLMLGVACIVAGCATSMRYTDTTQGEGPRGYVEFYVVPGQHKAFFNSVGGAVGFGTFNVEVADPSRGGHQALGIASGGYNNGDRLRIGCTPGMHRFSLGIGITASGLDVRKEVDVLVKDNMVTPVGVQITVLESTDRSRAYTQRYGNLTTSGTHAKTIPNLIDMKPASGQPQQYYDFYGNWFRYNEGRTLDLVSIEARSAAEFTTIRRDVEATLRDIDSLSMDSGVRESILRRRFRESKSGQRLAEGVVIRFMISGITVTGQSFE